MTRDETEALLRSASSGDEWCDVRTWQSHDGRWYAWIACGSTDTEPSPAALEACGVGPHATESSALAWLVDSVASGCEKHAAQLQQEADHLSARVDVLGEEIAALGVSASRLRAGIPLDATAEAPGGSVEAPGGVGTGGSASGSVRAPGRPLRGAEVDRE